MAAHRSSRGVAAAALLIWAGLLAAAGPVHAQAPAADPTGAVAETALRVPVRSEPDGSAVELDVTLYRPDRSGAFPAVLLAHGFGGSKADSAQRGRELAARGYVALAWSARGFGASGGRIHLDDPDFEVADARALVELLGGRSEVAQDGAGDPRVGVVGASYGGALALMLGSTDPRIDAVVAVVTWHDLAAAFFPQHALAGASPSLSTPAWWEPTPAPGPFLQLWASRFFASAAAPAAGADPGVPANPSLPANPVCGRFDPTVCRLFLAAAQTGQPSDELIAMLRAHSPAPLLFGMRAPTLLIQGMGDSLFGLEHADATARALADRVSVQVRWIDGGHDGAASTATEDEQALSDFLDSQLSASGPKVSPGPTFVFPTAIPRRASRAPLWQNDVYLGATEWTELPMRPGPEQTLLSPPGGQPASVTAIPGLGGLGGVAGGLAAYQLAALPGQSVAFDSEPVAQRVSVVGAPRIRLRVTSSATSATLFVTLWQLTGDIPSLPRKLVAPFTVATTPGQPVTVEVTLPAATWTVEAGSRLRVLVNTTDTGFAAPRFARVDRVGLAEPALRVPIAPAARLLSAESDADTESIGVGIALGTVLLVVAGAAWWSSRRRRAVPNRPDLADVPLVVDSLVKTYSDGHRAVDDVSWRAERGQVVGLLGPNGAGKTTTLRMVLGLIHPDSGASYLGGAAVQPGADALARVGALVEGPGFLPHLTGRANLHAYWAATGRDPAQMRLAEALDVAALGGAIDRPVRSYSHGMKQRLGIAQAMLGMPDLLVLDEPTNGLDPPQIAAMRPILQRYAATGRTVVVSSHLLGEVEQTCTHVVVMHAGRVVTTGRVADLVDSSGTTVVELAPTSTVAEVNSVAARLREVAGIGSVEVVDDEGDPRLVVSSGMPRPDVVRALTVVGADVVGVSSRKHLEEVFLGVIASASTAPANPSLTERLRQVRAR